MTVPRIIHQFWDRPDPPADISERMSSWRDQHPGWEHRLWNDDSAADFLAEHFEPEALLCYRAVKLPAMRADLIRLALLARIGGLYVDADMRCREPIDELAGAKAAIRIEAGKKTGKAKLANNFMLASPGHVLFERAFEKALLNVRGGEFSLHVSRLTGPMMLTELWAKRMKPADHRLRSCRRYSSQTPQTGNLVHSGPHNGCSPLVRGEQIAYKKPLRLCCCPFERLRAL